MKPEETVEMQHARMCYECQRPITGRRENYQYTEAGLSSVTLTNVLVYHCKCGAIVAELPAVGHLHNTIAFSLLRKKTLLSGEEARFLRKWVGFSATELAQTADFTKSAVSRWETSKKRISKDSDRLIRLIVFAKMLENVGHVTGVEDGTELARKIAEAAKRIKSLNISEILKRIENRHDSSKPLRIDPSIDVCTVVQ